MALKERAVQIDRVRITYINVDQAKKIVAGLDLPIPAQTPCLTSERYHEWAVKKILSGKINGKKIGDSPMEPCTILYLIHLINFPSSLPVDVIISTY